MAVLRARRGCKVAGSGELNGSDIGDVGGSHGKEVWTRSRQHNGLKGRVEARG